MKVAREAQIRQKEHFQAVQAERERQVFERILKSQIEEVSYQIVTIFFTVYSIVYSENCRDFDGKLQKYR